LRRRTTGSMIINCCLGNTFSENFDRNYYAKYNFYTKSSDFTFFVYQGQILSNFSEFQTYNITRKRKTQIIGICCGSLFHSLASCHALVGASGGIYALLGAGIIKIKTVQKYHGIRKIVHIFLSVMLMLFALADMTPFFRLVHTSDIYCGSLIE